MTNSFNDMFEGTVSDIEYKMGDPLRNEYIEASIELKHLNVNDLC